MEDLSYSEILKRNSEFKLLNANSDFYDIAVISNTTVNLFKEILEYSLAINNINTKVQIGDYDNIIQDSLKFSQSNAVFVFWEVCNLTEGLQHEIELFDDNRLSELLNKVELEIALVFENLKSTSLVLFNSFSSAAFSHSNIKSNKLEWLTFKLNDYFDNNCPKNVKRIELNKIISKIGIERSIDYRFFYSSKSLYKIDFYKTYVEQTIPLLLAVNGKTKKALIFDCDNTLWNGILGEDGFDGIDMSAHSKSGKIFREIQNIALSLSEQGVLLGVCSKNNKSDVDEVILNHDDMLLSNEVLTIKKVNWLDKATNLREMADELNIGLDSFVFVDDSSFEVNLIREQLPEIKVLQVPNRLHDYPKLLRDNLKLFYNLSYSTEDQDKRKMYKKQVIRESAKAEFNSIGDYLKSLELKVNVYMDDTSIISRMSQMTQKTNQFNLTTIRYTENDIQNFIECSKTKVIAWSVSDKFGDNGITGLCIIKLEKAILRAEIDTFLMSCRIIGRNVEFAIMDFLMNYLSELNISLVSAKYVPTKKNIQVDEFYKKNSFINGKDSDGGICYELVLEHYQHNNINYISIDNGK
jgi:FkbH-like protein